MIIKTTDSIKNKIKDQNHNKTESLEYELLKRLT